MTLAFALRGSDGLVVAADSRVTGSEGTADTSVKFLQVNREVGVITYGLAEPGYLAITRLVDTVNRGSSFPPERRIVYFSDIAKTAEKIFKEEFNKFYEKIKKTFPDIKPEDRSLTLGFILAGYDSNETNQFKVLSFQWPKFEKEERPDVLAAQWHIAQYLLIKFYYPEMDVEQLKRLAVFFLVETEIVEPTVGGPFQVAVVTLEHGFQRLSEKEVRQLITENQLRFAKFRRVLFDLFSHE